MHAQRVGEDRLDHVAVADRHPHRAGAVLGLDGGVAAAYGLDRAGLHRRHRLAAGERRRRRLGLHRPPELLLGQLLERPALPVAVVALGQPALAWRPGVRARCARRDRRGVCRHRSSGLVTSAASGTAASRSATARPARAGRRRGAPRRAGRPARPVALAVVRPCRTRITVAMAAEPYRASLPLHRDRRQRRLPQRGPGPAGLRRRRPATRCAAGARARRLRVGRPVRAQPRTSSPRSPTRSACTRWRSRTPSTPTSGPSSSATTTGSSWSSRRSGTSTRTTPSRPARSTCSSAHDFVVTRPARRGRRSCTTARARPRGARERCSPTARRRSSTPCATTVVDGYEAVVDGAADRRRRGRDVGVLATSAPTTRRGSTSSSASSPRSAGR